MASDYFQSYIQVLRRISLIDAEIQREQKAIDAQVEREVEGAMIYPPRVTLAAAEPAREKDAPLPGEEPLTLADTGLGRRFRGN